LYAGTNEDGVWKSTDGGNTWAPVGSLGQFPVYSLLADPSSHMIYAGTNGGGVWASSNDGATWQLSGLSNGMVFSLAVDSTGLVYAGTNSAGAQVSADFGETWTVMDTGVDGANKPGYGVWIDPGNSQNILTSFEAPIGLSGSRDGGASWSIAGEGFTGMAS